MALLTKKKKTNKSKKQYLYKDCSDLPIYNFDKVYKTENYMYLVVGYDGYKDVDIPEGYLERWKEIKEEWISLIDDNSITYYYQLALEVAYLQSRYDVSAMLLHQIWTRDMDEYTLGEYVKALKEWGYKYNVKNDKLDEVNRLMLQRKSSENKLSIKTDELKALREKNSGEEPKSLEAQAIILEKITEKNNIDLRSTSVKKWLEIQKLAEGINNQRKKQNGRK